MCVAAAFGDVLMGEPLEAGQGQGRERSIAGHMLPQRRRMQYAVGRDLDLVTQLVTAAPRNGVQWVAYCPGGADETALTCTVLSTPK